MKEINIDDHLKGTLEDQMQYNRRTLEDLNSILVDSTNQVCISLIIIHYLFCIKTYGWISYI